MATGVHLADHRNADKEENAGQQKPPPKEWSKRVKADIHDHQAGECEQAQFCDLLEGNVVLQYLWYPVTE